MKECAQINIHWQLTARGDAASQPEVLVVLQHLHVVQCFRAGRSTCASG